MKEELLEPFLRKMRIKRIKKYIPDNCVLCDIGCGSDAKFLNDMAPFIEKGIGIDKKVADVKYDKIRLIRTEVENRLPLPCARLRVSHKGRASSLPGSPRSLLSRSFW